MMDTEYPTHQPTKPTADEWIARMSGLRQIREAFWKSHPDGQDEGRRQSHSYLTLANLLAPSEVPKNPKNS